MQNGNAPGGNAPGCASLPMGLTDDAEPTVLLVFEGDAELTVLLLVFEDDAVPTVLLVFEDVSLELATSVSFLSRIVPVRSKHWLKTVTLDPEFVSLRICDAVG